MTATPYNFGSHTRYFPHGKCDYTINALHSESGDIIKVVSPEKIAERFGIKNYKYYSQVEPYKPYALSIRNNVALSYQLESFSDSIIRIIRDLILNYRPQLENTITRGALDINSKAIQVISLPIIYKILFQAELDQAEKLDIGLIIRNAIPEVKNRPKVLTLHSDTKQPIWILHYTVDDLPMIVKTMLVIHHL
jgi:hypothetical protein